jgi:hypothetical protein
MKKSELKNIIKECVKEVIFEEGVLSGIITEVAQGLIPLQEHSQHLSSPVISEQNQQRLKDAKKEVMSAVGRDAYADAKKKFSNPSLFEGTQPIPSEGSPANPLSGLSPDNPGVDISTIPGFGSWGAVANANFDK